MESSSSRQETEQGSQSNLSEARGASPAHGPRLGAAAVNGSSSAGDQSPVQEQEGQQQQHEPFGPAGAFDTLPATDSESSSESDGSDPEDLPVSPVSRRRTRFSTRTLSLDPMAASVASAPSAPAHLMSDPGTALGHRAYSMDSRSPARRSVSDGQAQTRRMTTFDSTGAHEGTATLSEHSPRTSRRPSLMRQTGMDVDASDSAQGPFEHEHVAGTSATTENTPTSTSTSTSKGAQPDSSPRFHVNESQDLHDQSHNADDTVTDTETEGESSAPSRPSTPRPAPRHSSAQPQADQSGAEARDQAEAKARPEQPDNPTTASAQPHQDSPDYSKDGAAPKSLARLFEALNQIPDPDGNPPVQQQGQVQNDETREDHSQPSDAGSKQPEQTADAGEQTPAEEADVPQSVERLLSIYREPSEESAPARTSSDEAPSPAVSRAGSSSLAPPGSPRLGRTASAPAQQGREVSFADDAVTIPSPKLSRSSAFVPPGGSSVTSGPKYPGDRAPTQTYSYTQTIHGRYDGKYASDLAREMSVRAHRRMESGGIKPANPHESIGSMGRRPRSIVTIFRQLCSPEGVRMNSTMFLLVMGLLVALIDYLIALAGENLVSLRDMIATSSLPYGARYALFILYTVVMVLAAIAVTRYVWKSARGSGIPQLKVILTDITVDKFFHYRALLAKTVGLTLALGSGLFIGKEGPFVHIASLTTDLLLKLPFFRHLGFNNASRKQLLSSAAAVGVASAVRAPVGGLLFSVEVTSVSYLISNYWKGFFAAMCGAVVNFVISSSESYYFWESRFEPKAFKPEELIVFALMGIVGGAAGAMFVHFQRHFVQFERRFGRAVGLKESRVDYFGMLVALVTALVSFPLGQYMRIPLQQSVQDLFSPNDLAQGSNITDATIPLNAKDWNDETHLELSLFLYGLVIFVLTACSTTIAVPAGLFLPTLACGAGWGRLVGEAMRSWFPSINTTPAAYAVVGAASMAAGVTRAVSTAVVVSEAIGSISLLLPILLAVGLAIMVGNQMSVDVYMSLLRINGLPYLPNLSSDKQMSLTARDAMIRLMPEEAAPPDPNADKDDKGDGPGGDGDGGGPGAGAAVSKPRLLTEALADADGPDGSNAGPIYPVLPRYCSIKQMLHVIRNPIEKFRDTIVIVDDLDNRFLLGAIFREDLARACNEHRQRAFDAERDVYLEEKRTKEAEEAEEAARSKRSSGSLDWSFGDDENGPSSTKSAPASRGTSPQTTLNKRPSRTDSDASLSLGRKNGANMQKRIRFSLQPEVYTWSYHSPKDSPHGRALARKTIFDSVKRGGKRSGGGTVRRLEDVYAAAYFDGDVARARAMMERIDNEVQDLYDFEELRVNPSPLQLPTYMEVVEVVNMLSLLHTPYAFVTRFGKLEGVVTTDSVVESVENCRKGHTVTLPAITTTDEEAGTSEPAAATANQQEASESIAESGSSVRPTRSSLREPDDTNFLTPQQRGFVRTRSSSVSSHGDAPYANNSVHSLPTSPLRHEDEQVSSVASAPAGPSANADDLVQSSVGDAVPASVPASGQEPSHNQVSVASDEALAEPRGSGAENEDEDESSQPERDDVPDVFRSLFQGPSSSPPPPQNAGATFLANGNGTSSGDQAAYSTPSEEDGQSYASVFSDANADAGAAVQKDTSGHPAHLPSQRSTSSRFSASVVPATDSEKASETEHSHTSGPNSDEDDEHLALGGMNEYLVLPGPAPSETVV